jgi:hypothetical protein
MKYCLITESNDLTYLPDFILIEPGISQIQLPGGSKVYRRIDPHTFSCPHDPAISGGRFRVVSEEGMIYDCLPSGFVAVDGGVPQVQGVVVGEIRIESEEDLKSAKEEFKKAVERSNA